VNPGYATASTGSVMIISCISLFVSGPIELEEADLITMTPPLSTPDMDRRDTPTSQERAKKDASGMSVKKTQQPNLNRLSSLSCIKIQHKVRFKFIRLRQYS